jgi:predicted Rossmann fold nucleotide-binding protein DprA/Smf involved in DNA uptake
MNKEAALQAIMLSELPQVGERGALRILRINHERGHTLGTFFRLPEAVLRDDYELHPSAIRRICGERELHERRCQWLADQLASNGGCVWSMEDPHYPARLRQRLRPAATVIYACGNPAVLHGLTLAVLQSRDLSEAAVAASLLTVQAAAGQGFTLVGSGMKSTYRITAVASRAAAAPRALVLDRGLFTAFGAHFDRDPSGLGPGRAALDAQRTFVVSPFRLLDHAVARNGKRRDAVVAALADVIVAVHARPGGEIEHVCLEALDRGQSVLSWYGENAGLVAAGATPIQESDLGNLRRFVPGG